MNPLRHNPPLLCAFHALQMSLFPMAILTVFFKAEIGMSVGEIFLLQGAFGLAMALFEFPSGYLADRIGYRRTLLLSSLAHAVGWSLYLRAQTITQIVAAELLLGIASSLVSGTDSALLYESLVEAGEEERFGHWNGRVRFFGQLGEGTAALAAGFLYAAWSRLPFAMEVGVWLLNALIAWRLVEPQRRRPELVENWTQIKAMVRHLFVESRQLRAVVFLTIALGMSSFVPVWTIQLYAVDAGMPEAWLGVLWAAANYTVAIGSMSSVRVVARIGLVRLVLVCIVLIAAGYAGMGLVHAAWGIGGYLLLTIMRGLFGPALHHEEHRLIPSSDRAGYVSLRSFLFRGAFLLLGPLVGGAIDRHGQRPVLLVVGALLVVASLLGLAAVERSRRPEA